MLPPVPEQHAPAEIISASRRSIAHRYQILNELGRGGMSAVHRVLDRLTGRVLTLKRLQMSADMDDSSAAELRLVLAQEFRLLASLRHPNIISVVDYGFDENDEPYLTMDLEESATTIVEAGADQPLVVQVELLVQTLRALVYLHRLGVIHRDLKPANILVVRGQVKVLDFGLSLMRGTADAGLAGTLAYMAPEVLGGAPPSERTDLFALGMVAYELMSGRYPFEERDPVALQHLLRTVSLPRPDDDVDPRMRPVLARLLSEDPALRYGDAREVIETLSAALDRPFPAETVATRESFLQAAPLIGRELELGALGAALEKTGRGNGSTWLVAGESGVGKSRLLDEFRTRALVEGVVVARGQARQGAGPYHLWRTVVGALLLRIDVADTAAAILKAIVPDIATLLGREPGDAPAVDLAAAQTRLFRAVEEVFRAQPRPVLAVLEDLQWAGSESLKLLAWLAQSAEGMPLLLVGSFRDDDAPTIPGLIKNASVLTLRRLTADEIAELSEMMIGPSGRRADLVGLLERESEGIPFFIVEVVRALGEDCGSLDQIGVAELPVRVLSGGMQRVVRRRLSQVPQSALPALRSAAVVGREIDSKVMRRLHPEVDLEQWAAACARTAVLERRDQRWRFSHDKLREQLLHDASGPALRALHRAVAETIEQVHGGHADFVVALAHHWQEAGEPMHEARYARQAGMLALQSAAYREAVTYLDRTLELMRVADPASAPAAPRRRSLVDPNAGIDAESREFQLGVVEGGLSEAYYRLGEVTRCRDHSQRALAHFGQAMPATNVGWMAAVVWQSLQRVLQGLTGVRSSDPERVRPIAAEVARVQLRLGETFFYSLRLLPILWATLRVVNQCEPAGRSPELAQGWVTLALLAGPARARRLADAWARRALAIAEGTRSDRNVAYIRSRIGVYQLGECLWEEAEAGLAQAAATAEREGDLRLLEEVRTQHAVLCSFTGRFEQSLALFSDGLRLSKRSGNRQIECWGLMGHCGALSRLGRDAEAIPFGEAALQLIDEETMRTEAIMAFGLMALVRLRTGDQAAAWESADRALWHMGVMKPVAYWLQPAIAATAEVLLALLESKWGPTPAVRVNVMRQTRSAIACLRVFARHFPLGRPSAYLWRGLAAWNVGRERRAMALWQRAVTFGDHLGMSLEQARAHFEIGRHLAPETPGQRSHLHQAAELFERMGCAADLARVQRTIAESVSALRGSPACA